MINRYQPWIIKWPVDASQLKRINDNFNILFNDTRNGTQRIRADQIDPALLPAQGGTGLTSFVAGDMIYAIAAAILARLPIGAVNTMLWSNGSLPSWTDAPMLATSLTTPLLIGGIAGSSVLTLKSTSGVGTTDAIVFLVGNNGATEGLRIKDSGSAVCGVNLTVLGSSFLVGSNAANGATAEFNDAAGAVIRLNRTATGGGTGPLGYVDWGSGQIGTGRLAEIYVQEDGAIDSAYLSIWTKPTGSGINERVRIDSVGHVGIGQTTPTAILHLKAGTASASSAPLKLASGTVLTTAEVGAIEFTTDDFFATITTGAARKAFVLDNGARLTSGKIPTATTNGRLVDGPSYNVGTATISANVSGTAAVAIFDHYVDAGNVTTGETDLYSDTILAGQLAANGDKLYVDYGGIFVSSASATRQLKAYFGGTAIFDSGALSISAGSDAWNLYVMVIRVSASVVRCSISMTTTGAALNAYSSYAEVTGLTLANTQIVKITGTAAGVGAATNDIVAKLGSVQYARAA